MSPKRIRRSTRLDPYDSNGREYLAYKLGWSREELESWIVSPSVRPHLQLWYNICISGLRRFNDAIEWINTGDNGYFYNPSDLEEDLLLMCLGEGSGLKGDGKGQQQGKAKSGAGRYADENAKTGRWITQEIWARTAWRIVNDNRFEGQGFAKTVEVHPASCYAIVIDMLCLAFHSIAFRGMASPYEQLINDSGYFEQAIIANDACLSDDDDASTSSLTDDWSSDVADRSSDGDFGEKKGQ